MNTRTGMIRLHIAILIAGFMVSPLATLPATASVGPSCSDHFNWRKGSWFPEKAHSGGEIPGEGWTVHSLHSVSDGEEGGWHSNLEGGYSEEWHETCLGGGPD
jgi:hypothetical protein